MRIPAVVLVLSAAVLPVLHPAVLQAQTRTTTHHGADAYIGVRSGTLGIGGEVAKLVNSHLALRVGANFFNYSTTREESDISFDAELRMKAVSALIDLFPSARGSFHLTGGLMTNPADIKATGVPNSNGNFTINDVQYTAADVGVLTGEGKWPKTSPYAGIGWGTPAARHGALKFVFDLGAVIGKPTITMSATGNVPGLQANVAAQQAKTQKDVEKYAKVYPVISFGLVYRF
jgi:hypothetical protein